MKLHKEKWYTLNLKSTAIQFVIQNQAQNCLDYSRLFFLNIRN